MLEMRPDCETCGVLLPAEAPGAFICSFECTFCEACAGGELAGACPNCSGVLMPRPPRATALLERFPPQA